MIRKSLSVLSFVVLALVCAGNAYATGGSPTCVEYSATNLQHETAGRAWRKSTGTWWVTTQTWYAVGSNDNLGNYSTTTTVLNEQPVGSNNFAKGECPSEPQPPVITSYEISTLTNSQAVITGTATDPDNNIDHVMLGLGIVTGLECSGTTSFTCTINFDEYGIVVGNSIAVNIAVYDTTELMTLSDWIQVVRPDVVTPVITSYEVSTLTYAQAIVTGTIADPDNRMGEVVLGLAAATGLVCSGTTSFTCVLNFDEYGIQESIGVNLAAYDIDDSLVDSSGPFLITRPAAAPTCVTATNASHSTAGRATLMYNVLYYAKGSNDYLGMATASSTLKETAPNYWKKVTSCQ